jgi:NAD-dependent SIR2 family protein deacetylase
MHSEDCIFSDYLICVGTSLEVYPFAGIADSVPLTVPRLLLNREAVGSFGSRGEDAMVLGDLVGSVRQLAEELGWGQELEALVKS